MGLLDEAIREHLELKRRRGADPSEVARQQREALAPVPGGGEATAESEGEAADEPQADELVEPTAHPGGFDEDPTEAHEQLQPGAAGEEAVHQVQETAEMDMETVLDDHAAAPRAEAPDQGHVVPAQATTHPDDELEWELPAEDHALDERSEPPREIPGQERMSFE